jgi:hypothetical protein
MHFTIQPIPEADHLCQNLQVSFDSMLCNILKEYYSFPRFTLFLGSLCQFLSPKQPYNLEEMVASLSLIREQGEGHILDDIGFSSLSNPMLPLGADGWYLAYFEKLLESPERSGTHIFDQKRYATAAKECLQLYLCSHHNFSKRATELACHDKALCRNKPSAWISRLGFYSRIRKARHHFKVEQYKSLKARLCITQHSSFPENSPEHQYCRFVTYRRALDLLPFFLERSAIYLELANVLRSCTFTTMAWKFPRRRRLAKEAIVKYLLRVESAVGKA